MLLPTTQNRAFLEKLKTAKVLRESPTLHETQIFITVLTTACWWTHSRIRIESTAILFSYFPPTWISTYGKIIGTERKNPQ
jgi:hypothetical protein